MNRRKLPEDFERDPYLRGYLHQLVESGDFPEYGYQTNHLPKTTNKPRAIESGFSLAKRRKEDA